MFLFKFCKGVEERLEQIFEIKIEFDFLCAMQKFFRIIKLRLFIFFIIEILFICFSFYYIHIFCILYYNCQVSLIENYIMSLIESLIISIVITIVIVMTRIIGIIFLNRNFYNTSKFINNKF